MHQQSLQGKPKNAQHGQNVPNTTGENSATRSRNKIRKQEKNKKKREGGRTTNHHRWTTVCSMAHGGGTAVLASTPPVRVFPSRPFNFPAVLRILLL